MIVKTDHSKTQKFEDSTPKIYNHKRVNELEFSDSTGDDFLDVAFTQKAYNDLIAHAKSSLDLEICGVFVGQVDEAEDNATVHVQAIIQGDEAEQKRIQVTFKQKTWNRIYEILEQDYPDLLIVGWYHTHPGFGVEFSDMDVFVHKNFFPSPTQIALVTDPLSNDFALCINSPKGIATLEWFQVAEQKIRCHNPNYKADSKEVQKKLKNALRKIEKLQKKLPDFSKEDDAKKLATLSEADRADFVIMQGVNSPQRIFPKIEPDLYNNLNLLGELTPDQKIARRILKLHNQKLSFRQRYRGQRLHAVEKLGRLLLLHKMAMSAELEYQWERADIFWREMYDQFKVVYKQNKVWQTVVENLATIHGVKKLNDPEQLRQILMNEIFMDAHCGFYNDRIRQIQKLRSDDRAFVHYLFLQELVKLSELSAHKQVAILSPPTKAYVRLLEAKKRRKQAIRLCSQVLLQNPGDTDLQNRLAELHFADTIRKVKKRSSKPKNWRNAKTLSKGIQVMTALHKSYPENTTVEGFLGRLHAIRAVQLGNSLQHSEQALVEAQKAAILFEKAVQRPNNSNGRKSNGSEKRRKLVTKTPTSLSKRSISKIQKKGFPFTFWLFSKQNRSLKVQAAIAVILVALTISIGIYDFEARRTRNMAYEAVLQAVDNDDYIRILDEAERFLSTSPFNKNDVRIHEVIEHYKSAFVRWFLMQDDNLNNEALFRIKRYEAFNSQFTKQG
jgi:proteasome lid subunit RPN8/RPN11